MCIHTVQYVHVCESGVCVRLCTFACCRGDTYAEQVLQSEQAGQKTAVARPGLGNGLPVAMGDNGDQAKGVEHEIGRASCRERV